MSMRELAKKASGIMTSLKQGVNKINRGGLPGGRQTGPNAFKHLKRGPGSPAGPKLSKPKKKKGPR